MSESKPQIAANSGQSEKSPAADTLPGQVIALPKRESAAGTEIMPNVGIRTVADRQDGTSAKIVIVSSGFGIIRETIPVQNADSRSSLCMAA